MRVKGQKVPDFSKLSTEKMIKRLRAEKEAVLVWEGGGYRREGVEPEPWSQAVADRLESLQAQLAAAEKNLLLAHGHLPATQAGEPSYAQLAEQLRLAEKRLASLEKELAAAGVESQDSEDDEPVSAQQDGFQVILR